MISSKLKDLIIKYKDDIAHNNLYNIYNAIDTMKDYSDFMDLIIKHLSEAQIKEYCKIINVDDINNELHKVASTAVDMLNARTPAIKATTYDFDYARHLNGGINYTNVCLTIKVYWADGYDKTTLSEKHIRLVQYTGWVIEDLHTVLDFKYNITINTISASENKFSFLITLK